MIRSSKPTQADSVATHDQEPNALTWETLSSEAYEAYNGLLVDQASRLWREAMTVSQSIPPEDPRHCATLNNAGIVDFLDEALDRSVDTLNRALAGWQKARDWTASMEVNGTAKSSLFHHRLEVRHQKHFAQHTRSRYCNWIDGAEAITAFNLSQVLGHLNRKEEALRHLTKALNLRQQAFGSANPELALILRSMARLSDDETVSASCLEHAHQAERNPTRTSLQRWQADCPRKMNDTRRLLGAICMTAMMAQAG